MPWLEVIQLRCWCEVKLGSLPAVELLTRASFEAEMHRLLVEAGVCPNLKITYKIQLPRYGSDVEESGAGA